MKPQSSQHVQDCVAKALAALDAIDLDELAGNGFKMGGISVRIRPTIAQNSSATHSLSLEPQ
jgi:hypothetical protein